MKNHQHHTFHRMHHEGRPFFGGWGPGGPFRESREAMRGGHGARRGEARFLLLDALRSGPKHGYEIIKALEERSGGRYAPSPGTVYPTLQMLEDLGLIVADTAGEKRVFSLTEDGTAELEAHSQDVEGFWQRLGPGDSEYEKEIRFLRDEMEHLVRVVRSTIGEARSAGGVEVVKAVRQAVVNCQGEVRMLADGGSPSRDATRM